MAFPLSLKMHQCSAANTKLSYESLIKRVKCLHVCMYVLMAESLFCTGVILVSGPERCLGL